MNRSLVIFPSTAIEECLWCSGGEKKIADRFAENGQICLCKKHKTEFLMRFASYYQRELNQIN